MFCSNCGKELPDGTRFCSQCGTELAPAQAQQQAQATPEQPTPAKQSYAPSWYVQPTQESAAQANNDQPGAAQIPPVPPAQNGAQQQPQPPKKKGISKSVLIAMIAAAAVMLVLIIVIPLILLHKPTINLNKYVIVTFEGYDTVGTATVEFDYDALEKDYGKKLNKTIKVKADSQEEQRILEAFGEDTREVDVYDFVNDCVDCMLDVEDGLSNGDTVTLTWECDEEEALETFGVKLKYKDESYTAEGLEEADTFDPFADIEVTFDGIAPNGTVSYANNATEEITWNYKYSFDQTDGLSNGDTVTLTVSMSSDDIVNFSAEKYGKIPSPLSKTYTVEGLQSYVMSMSDISSEDMDGIIQDGENYFMDIVEDWDEEHVQLNSLTYLGSILLTKKEDSYSYDQNRFYMVYRAVSHILYERDNEVFEQDVTQYWYVRFTDLWTDTDGSLQADTCRDAGDDWVNFKVDSGLSGGWFSTKAWTYSGYQSYQELYQALVADTASNYDAENTVDDSVADEAVESVSAGASEDYLCEYSADRELTEDDVETYLAGDYSDYNFPGDRTIIQMIINEMYARHGYQFTDSELTDYFSQKSWYSTTSDDMDKIYQNMSDIEKSNVELLEKYK